MKTKACSPEQIARLLREGEAGQAQGKTVEDVCRTLGISTTGHHRRKNQYGGTRTDEVRRLEDPEEDERLKQLVAHRPWDADAVHRAGQPL